MCLQTSWNEARFSKLEKYWRRVGGGDQFFFKQGGFLPPRWPCTLTSRCGIGLSVFARLSEGCVIVISVQMARIPLGDRHRHRHVLGLWIAIHSFSEKLTRLGTDFAFKILSTSCNHPTWSIYSQVRLQLLRFMLVN
jgi:hypothetical protein